MGGVATILGPLWAGGLTENLYIMLGVMMGLLSLLMVSTPGMAACPSSPCPWGSQGSSPTGRMLMALLLL